MPLALQLVVPLAVPLPPRLFAHVTWVTPTLSAAVPPSVRGEFPVVYVELEVGEVMATVGGVVSVTLPVTILEMMSRSAAKVRFAVAVADMVGLKRTVTAWLAPTPRVKGLPESML